ncbi:cytidylate kinase-like family protein [Geomesophilobacter sediminis]|uniref:Cytidylate kinase-like family protein n=1 Tax=Geomesophilobacter sediminis TaxID=2798584 RepID=A0A8J7JCX0_9BACT|nr:cytidylate kinase-like family protein [Geomesophilobacter sediminis]MBJ6725196.1 cytidylate kinase-like family protein [Geomesophilobacter sediminis]
MSHVIITISREYACGGAWVAQQLARRLGIRYLDREILHEAAQVLREDESLLAEREERCSGFFEKAFRVVALGTVDAAGYLPPPMRLLYDEDLFAVESEIIKKVTECDSAVIIGRAAFHVLQGNPDLVSVFLHADKQYRIKRLMEIHGIATPELARATLEESDRIRRTYVERMIDTDWTDARNYHLCIDTAVVGLEGTVELILRHVEAKTGMKVPETEGGA